MHYKDLITIYANWPFFDIDCYYDKNESIPEPLLIRNTQIPTYPEISCIEYLGARIELWGKMTPNQIIDDLNFNLRNIIELNIRQEKTSIPDTNQGIETMIARRKQ